MRRDPDGLMSAKDAPNPVPSLAEIGSKEKGRESLTEMKGNIWKEILIRTSEIK